MKRKRREVRGLSSRGRGAKGLCVAFACVASSVSKRSKVG
jgi:hypothetical protein